MTDRGTNANVEPDFEIDLNDPLPETLPPPPSAAQVSARGLRTLPAPGAAEGAARPLTQAEAQELLALYEREVKALGNDPAAARLHYEMGLLWDEQLRSPRNAAVCYQNAYRLAPKFVPNLQAARRLFAAVGNWGMVAQLLDAEAAALPSDEGKVALALEKALVLEERLGRADEALALLQQQQSLAPRNVPVLVHLEAMLVARGDAKGLQAVRVQLADAVQDPALKAHLLTAAAQLCEGPLGQPAEAAALYRRARGEGGGDAALLAAVKRAADREARPQELLDALSAEAALAGPSASSIHYRISRVWERQGDAEQALEALLAARRANPADPLVLDELVRAFESAGRWEELAGVLRDRLARLADSAELIALNLRLGALYEEKLRREDDAIGCYRAVLEAAPSHPVAVAALGKLYARKQNWEGLMRVLEAEIACTDDPRQKAGRLYKAAELLEGRLGREEDAISRYVEILKVQPSYLPAQKALARIYERLGRWDELIALYEQDLAETKDRDQTIAVLSRIASLHEERRQDLPAAVASLRRILEVAPDHLPTIRDLGRLCERAGLWEQLLQTHELEASLAGDSKRVIWLLHSNAEIYEEQLKQKEPAIEAYKKVLALSPTYLPALKALGRLYAQEGRWAELVEMNRQEAEITPSPEQAAGLIARVGELLEEKLGKVDEAIAAYQEVLTLSPVHFPAMRALSRIYRGQKAWENLVEIQRAEAAAQTDPTERANTLCQVAALWEDELRRADLAIETYQQVLELVPSHAAAGLALERLWSGQGRWAELAALYEKELEGLQDPIPRVAALEKLAALYGERLADPAQEARCYEALLSMRPDHLRALKGLEGLRGADRASRAVLRARLARVARDPGAASTLHLASALDRERAGLGEPVLEDLRAAAELSPGDPRVSAEYERALRRAGDWPALELWLQGRLAAERDPETLQVLRLRLGEVCEWYLGRTEKALEAYRAAIEADPACLPALRAARRILMRAGADAEVLRLLLAEGQASRDVRSSVDLLLDAGRLAEERLKDFASARQAYEAVLSREPLEPRANDRLERLLAAAGAVEELVALHLKRGGLRSAGRDASRAAEEYVAGARLLANDLKSPSRALEALDQALAQLPGHPAALQLRGDLCLSSGLYPEAAQAYYQRIEQGGDPRELALLHYRLAVILQDNLNEAGRAGAHLQTSLATSPDNLDALERLAWLHLNAGNWSGAAEPFGRLVGLETDAKRKAKHLCAFARVHEEGFGDLRAAASHLQSALDLCPGDGAVVDKLVRLYEQLDEPAALATLLEGQAQQLAREGDKSSALGLRLRAAELYQRQLDPVRAIQNFRFAIDLAPDHVGARAALAELLARGDAASQGAAIEEHRHILRIDPFCLDSYHALHRLYGTGRHADRTLCADHVLAFFRALGDAEGASFAEARGHSVTETSELVPPQELDGLLQHPAARHPLTELMRLIGDQLDRIYEPALEQLGLGRGDRLKAEHPLHKLMRGLCTQFGVEKFELYQGKHGHQVTLENTDPLSVVVGPEFVRRFNAREQRFYLARAAWQLRNKTALAYKLDLATLADLLGAAVRVALPGFDRIGRSDPELTKRIRKALSGKSIKQIEALAPELASARSLDVSTWLQSATWSADRAGLVFAGDICATLQLLLREDAGQAGSKVEGTEAVLAAARRRKDIAELLVFVLSDDHFRLRGRLKLGLV